MIMDKISKTTMVAFLDDGRMSSDLAEFLLQLQGGLSQGYNNTGIAISLVVYNTNLREMTKIATNGVPVREQGERWTFWSFLKLTLKQYTGNNEYVFKPHLYVFYEGGGFWASQQDNLEPEEVQRAVSCERHWGFLVDRNANKLISEDVKEE